MNDNEERLEAVESKTRDLLSQFDFLGKDNPIVRGSASGALQRESK